MECPNCASEDVTEFEVTDDYDRYVYTIYECEECLHDSNNKAKPYVYPERR